MKLLHQYIIRPETMALLPYCFSDGSLGTLVIEETREHYVVESPKTIVEKSCGYYGSTYKGRKKIAIEMGYKSMPPICVCGELGIVFISSMTERSDRCAWIAFIHVRQWREVDKKNKVAVSLTNGQIIELPMNPGPFSGRVMRAMQYRHQLRERISSYNTVDKSEKKMIPKKIGFKSNGTYSIDSNLSEDELIENET
ncbi:competence protein ComK [Sporolactobacillus shoreicorticis]|uniref:Competence protein ComK n=1 Tax=Sporolactobacillus shoreicorticis TaxID=1923877 RepID=A0ABW5S8C0_9BACL|nr:competence protein ComK [Sporolactobacillus shoreicorticis]MCO7126928.1 competence protein ComK [Sporolactobacillus shoreicorticis]